MIKNDGIIVRIQILCWLILIIPLTICAQNNSQNENDSTLVENEPAKPWYFYENQYFSASPLVALAMDITKYNQDDTSIEQVGNQKERYEPGQIRAIRLGITGRIKFLIPWSYMFSVGYRAFDVGFDTDSSATFTVFDARIDIPTIIGIFAIGMMKEPISMQRIMPGAFLPGIERPMQLDGLLPARNIGIQWIKSLPGRRASISIGWFNDWLQSGESFSNNRQQIAGRLTVIPLNPVTSAHLIHLGISGRYSNWKGGTGRARATPEAYFASYYVDTDVFSGQSSRTLALEASWKYRSFWVSGEYVGASIKSDEADNPFFSGFNVDATWAVTGEERLYLRGMGLFGHLIPNKNVHNGGPGAIELVTRYSQLDLDGGNIEGGKMDRWTLGVNWYPTMFTRLSIHYGYVTLDRFNLTGITQIWQTRFMLIL